MSKVKVRWITIMALIALLAVCLSAAVGALLPVRRAAKAIDYAPTSVFSAGSGSEVGASEAEGDEPSFVRFSMPDGGNVYFRRDLALRWYEASDETSALANPGKETFFNMTFAFPSVEFQTFTIRFESDEENISKEGQAVNALVFEKTAEGALTVKVKSAEEQNEDNEALTAYTLAASAASATDDITVSFAAGQSAGEYVVNISYAGTPVTLNEDDVFTNIGGNFLEYRSTASSTPNTPVTFTAELPETAGNAEAGEDEGEEASPAKQDLLMKSLNGQSFELTESGRVEDNAAPVLVLNEKVFAFTLGRRFSLSYETIDVCDDSVTVTRSYYMLRRDENGNYVKPVETPSSEDKEESDGETSADFGYKQLTTSTYFLPPAESEEEKEYVSIRFQLDDGRSGESEYVYLTWYADAQAVATLGEGENAFDYILVNREKSGPVYTGVTPDDATKTNLIDGASYDRVVAAYEDAVADASEGISAGSGSYFYLPSLRDLISSPDADYRNLRFSIYYYSQSQVEGATASSETSLRYNNLRFEVDEKGTYVFRVIASDASDNAMEMYLDGELVEVTSDNVWEIDEIPEFTITVGYTGATIEDPGTQTYGYRDRTYNIEDFEIIALDGYVTEYTLYYFDESALPSGVTRPSYSACVENAEHYVTKEYKACMREIGVYNNEYSEDDEEWDRTDNAYEWDPDSSLSFNPQLSGIYFVRVTVTDPNRPGVPKEAYQAIEVRNPVDIISGQTQWLENNTTSVILFAVSGVLAVAIVVLLVVKPSDKKVEEIDLEKLKGKHKKQK